MAEREEFIIPEELLGDGDITIIDSSVEVYERTVDMEVVESETEVDMEVIPDERIMDMEVDHFVVGTPTGGGGVTTEETDPTVPDWAKQPTKPRYTASEVGADALGSASSALELAKAYTDEQIEKIPTPDVSGQIAEHDTDPEAHGELRQRIDALKIPTKVSDLDNDKGYLTEHQSLDGYATEDWVNSQDFLKEHQSLEGYATEQWVEEKNYLTEHQSLDDYAKKEDIPTTLPASDVHDWAKEPNKPSYTAEEVGADPVGSADTALGSAKAYTDEQISAIEIPTKVSELENDSKYLTEHQSLDGYATEEWVEGKGYLTQHQDLSDYAKRSEIPTIPTKVSAFENDKGYLTSLGADYILESGTSKGWRYEKWNSGKYICWGTFQDTRAHYTTVNGFYGYYSSDFPYPITFPEPPIIHFNCKVGSGFAAPAGDVLRSSSLARCYALSTASGEVSCAWEMYVVGKWK